MFTEEVVVRVVITGGIDTQTGSGSRELFRGLLDAILDSLPELVQE